MSAIPTLATGLLRELQDKLIGLRKKRDALLMYFKDTKGHDYLRAPQLTKVEKAIKAVESEITLVDPTATFGAVSDLSQVAIPNEDEPNLSQPPPTSASAAILAMPSTKRVISWVIESLLGSAAILESTPESTINDTDCRFLMWIIKNLNDGSLVPFMLQLQKLPPKWKVSIVATQCFPSGTFESMEISVAKGILRDIALDHCITMQLNSDSRNSLLSASDQERVNSSEALVWALLRRMTRSAALSAFGIPYEAFGATEARKSAAVLQNFFYLGWASAIDELLLPDIMRRCMQLVSSTLANDGHGYSRFSSASIETVRREECRRLHLYQIVTELWQQINLYFTRLPPRILHMLLRQIWSSRHQQRLDELQMNDVKPIGNMLLSLIDTQNLRDRQRAPTEIRSNMSTDEHTLDILRNPFWLKHTVVAAVSDLRRACALDLSRAAEEKYWAYFLQELKSCWSESFDEHVVAAFVHGCDHDEGTGSPQFSSTASPSSGKGSPHNRAASPDSVGTEIGSIRLEQTASVVDTDLPETEIDPDVTSKNLFRENSLFPQVSTVNFSVSGCSVHHTVVAPAGVPEARLGVVIGGVSSTTQESQGYVYTDGSMTGPKAFVSGAALNVKSEVGASADDLMTCGKAFAVAIPIQAAGEVGEHFFGWATQSFRVGPVSSVDPSVQIGRCPRSVGASVSLERIEAELDGAASSLELSRGPCLFAPAVDPGATFRVRVNVWSNGGNEPDDAQFCSELCEETIFVPVVPGTSNCESEATVDVTSVIRLDSSKRNLEFSFSVADVDVKTVLVLPVDSELSKSGYEMWFPGASFGRSNTADSTNSFLNVDTCNSPGQTALLGIPASSTSRSAAQQTGAKKSTFQKPNQRSLKKKSWTFFLGVHHAGCQPLDSSSRVMQLFRILDAYTHACCGLLAALEHDAFSKEDFAASKLREFLKDFTFGELHLQYNQLDDVPPVFLPKPLDIDDILELACDTSEIHTNALRRLGISDKSLARNVMNKDTARDARWFPGLVRPETRSKSRFGSIFAMKKTAEEAQWSVLVDLHDNIRAPPLHAALMIGEENIALSLSRCPAVDVNATDSSGNTPLILAVLLGFTSVVRILVDERSAAVHIQNFNGLTAFHIAIMNGQEVALRLMLDRPNYITADVINLLTRNRSNAVAIATKLRNLPLVDALLRRGGLPCVIDSHGVTPLSYALKFGCLSIASRILDEASQISVEQINAREKHDPKGTALLYAARRGYCGFVEKLLNLGADPTTGFSDPPHSVVHAAVLSRKPECVRTLMRFSSICSDAVLLNFAGFGSSITALHAAAELRDFDCLDALMHSSADPNATDAEGRTPLMVLLAVCSSAEERIAAHYAHGSKRRLRGEMSDRNGRTALFYAVARGFCEVATILIESCRASVNTMDIVGFTPLTFALAHNQDGAAEALLHVAGNRINLLIARPNVPQPIEFAFQRGSIRVCRMIIEYGGRCQSEMRAAILGAHVESSEGIVVTTCDRKIPSAAQISPHNLKLESVCSEQLERIERDAIAEVLGRESGAATCASALLAWQTANCGDPQHRRISSNCFGVASSIRPTLSERLAQRVLDFTFSGDEAIEVLKRLESVDLATVRRGETASGSNFSMSVAPCTVVSTEVIDLDAVAAPLVTLSPVTPLSDLISQLIPIFADFIPSVKSERALRLASTQVLMLLVEARTNAARHAHLPLSTGGYEMSLPRLEALAFQALQLNRESSVVKELSKIFEISESSKRPFNVNTPSRSKWRGRNCTMLHLAILASNGAAVRYLLSKGADPLIDVNADGPVPAADLEFLWKHDDQVGVPGFVGPFMHIPCPLLCALRLGHEDVCLALLPHIENAVNPAQLFLTVFVPTVKPNGAEQPEEISSPRRKKSVVTLNAPAGPSSLQRNNSCAYHSVRVPLLHMIIALSPHHGWTNPRSVAKLWQAALTLVCQLSARDPITHLTPLQLAVICGRSDVVEWILRSDGRKVPQSAIRVDTRTLATLFHAIGSRFVNYRSIVKLLHQALLESPSSPLSRGRTLTHVDVVASLVDLCIICCPSVALALLRAGYEIVPPKHFTSSTIDPSESFDDATLDETSAVDLETQLESSRRSIGSPAVSSPRRRESVQSSPRRQSRASSLQTSASLRTASLAVVPKGSRRSAASLRWNGDSALHRALRALCQSRDVHISSAVQDDGKEQSDASTPSYRGNDDSVSSLQNEGSRRESFCNSVCAASLRLPPPGRYVSRGLFRAQLSSIAEYLLKSIQKDVNSAMEVLADATETLTATIDAINAPGKPFLSGNAATLQQQQNEAAIAAGESSVASAMTKVMDCCRQSPLFAADESGDTPFHLVMRSGDSRTADLFLESAHSVLEAFAKQLVRPSPRAPNASIQALHAKILEMKGDVLLASNAHGETVLDTILQHAMTPSWFSLALGILGWLPVNKHRHIFAQNLASKVHLSALPSLYASSDLLTLLATEYGSRETSAENGIASLPASIRALDPCKVTSLAILGWLYLVLSGDLVAVRRALSRHANTNQISAVVPKVLTIFVDPFISTMLIANSKIAWNLVSVARSSSVKLDSSVTRDRSPQNLRTTSKFGRPSTAAVMSVSFRETKELRDDLDSRRPPSSRPQSSAVIAPRPPSASTSVGLNSGSSSMPYSERYALNLVIMPSCITQYFNDHFSATAVCRSRHFSPFHEDSFPVPLHVIDALDDLASVVLNVFSDSANHPCIRAIGDSQQANRSREDPRSSNASPKDPAASWLISVLRAAASCGLEHVLLATRHRVLASTAGSSDVDRGIIPSNLFHDASLLMEACLQKRPGVLFFLCQCGSPVSRKFFANRNGGTTSPVEPLHSVPFPVFFDAVLSNLKPHKGPPSVPRRSPSTMERVPLPIPETAFRCAARACLLILCHFRCSLSESSITSLVNNADIMDLNERSAHHGDTLLHLAVINQCLEAIVAISHCKSFTAPLDRNRYGLRAWEYSATPLTLEYVLGKRSNLAQYITFHAAVAVLPSDFSERISENRNADDPIISVGKNQHKISSGDLVPQALLSFLRDHCFVIEGESSTISFFSIETPVVRVTLPAVVLQKHSSSLLSASSTKPLAPQNSGTAASVRRQPSPPRNTPAAAANASTATVTLSSVQIVQPHAENSQDLTMECEKSELTDVQKLRAVLLYLSEGLDGGNVSISDIALFDPNAKSLRRGRGSRTQNPDELSLPSISMSHSVSLPHKRVAVAAAEVLNSQKKGISFRWNADGEQARIAIIPMYGCV